MKSLKVIYCTATLVFFILLSFFCYNKFVQQKTEIVTVKKQLYNLDIKIESMKLQITSLSEQIGTFESANNMALKKINNDLHDVAASILKNNEIKKNDGSFMESPSITEKNKYNEKRVRIILADITLGNVAGYYRAHNSPEDLEAIKRWDAGIRVTNIKDFSRTIVPGKGWQIVFDGTMKSIDGMDVHLSTDNQ